MISRIKATGAAAPRTARESGLAFGKVSLIVVAIGLVMSFGTYMLNFGSRAQARDLASAQSTIEAMQRVAGTGDDPPERDRVVGIATAPVRVIEREAAPVVEIVEVVVTATPTETPAPTATPNLVRIYEYVEVPVEVTRVVYQLADPMPTATPTRLASGQVVICVHVAGVKEVYIEDTGIASGGCVAVGPAGTGQTHYAVKVNR